MSEPDVGKVELERAAAAGLVTHVVSVFGDQPEALYAQLSSAELQGLDAVALGFLCERWPAPVVRVAPLLYGVAAAGREEELDREAARLARKLTGAETPGVVCVRPIEAKPAPSPAVASLKDEIARLEQELAQTRSSAGGAERLEAVIARLERAQAAIVGDPERRESLTRHLAALRFAVREIAARAEEVKAAAEGLSGQAAERADGLERRLDAIAQTIAALETRASARAQRDFTPETESFQRVLVGFRTVLRELSGKAASLGVDDESRASLESKLDRIAQVLETAAPSGEDLAQSVAAKLETRFEAIEERLAARAGVPASELAFGKDSFVRLVAGFRVVLRRLNEQADELASQRTSAVAAAPVLDEAALETIARRVAAHLAQDTPEPPAVVERAEVDDAALERLAQRVAGQVSGAMAEGLALLERRHHETIASLAADGAQRLEALASHDGVGFALDRIARRVEALHEDLSVRFASLARADGDDAAADRAAQRLAAGVQEAKALMSEFLGIAAALTRDLDRAPISSPTPQSRANLLRADARLLRRPA